MASWHVGTEIDVKDEDLGKKQNEIRKSRHKENKSEAKNIDIGDNVLRLEDGDKLKAKEMYKVLDIIEEDGKIWYIINKCNDQFRARSYRVKGYQIIPAPGYDEKITRKAREIIEEESEKIDEENSENEDKAPEASTRDPQTSNLNRIKTDIGSIFESTRQN